MHEIVHQTCSDKLRSQLNCPARTAKSQVHRTILRNYHGSPRKSQRSTDLSPLLTEDISADCDEDDELLAPCLCRGTLKFVHRQCLNQWRICGRTHRSMTNCGICGARFKLRILDNVVAAEGKVWQQVLCFIGLRVMFFLVAALLIGFVPPMEFGLKSTDSVSHPVLKHFVMGAACTLASIGHGVSIWAMSFHFLFDPSERLRWEQLFKNHAICFVVFGALVVLLETGLGIVGIRETANDASRSHQQHMDKRMRAHMVQRFQVLNYEDSASVRHIHAIASADSL